MSLLFSSGGSFLLKDTNGFIGLPTLASDLNNGLIGGPTFN